MMIDQSLFHLNELISLGHNRGNFKIEQREDGYINISVGEVSYIVSGEFTMESLLSAHVSIKSRIAEKEKWYG